VMGPTLTSVLNHVAEVVSLMESSADAPVYGRIMVVQFKPGKGEEISAKARAEFIPALQQQPGFIRHVAFRPGADRTITFTAFASREHAEATEAATQWWREYVTPLAVSMERHVGEVVWSVRKD